MMNVSRRAANGEVDPNDKMNKSQIYITSAGFRDHFSYQKQIQLLVWQIVRPGTAFVMGGSWRIKFNYWIVPFISNNNRRRF